MKAGTLRNAFMIDRTEVAINQDSVDIDFRVESDGNANMLFVDAANNRVGIATNSPTCPLDILTNLSSDTTTSPDTVLTISTKYTSTGADGGAGAGPRLEFKIPDDETNPITGAAIAGIKESADDSDASAGMAFYISQNDTTLDEAVRIDHDGKMGIGTASPSYPLDVSFSGHSGIRAISTSGDSRLYLTSDGSANASSIFFGDDAAATIGGLVYDHNANALKINTNDAEVMRINSSGQLSIDNTSNTWGKLNVHSNSATVASAVLSQGSGSGNALEINNANTDQGGNIFKVSGTGATTITTADNLDTLSLVSTDADGNVGPNLVLYRNSASPADGDMIGQIRYNGENSAGETISYAKAYAETYDITDGTEDGRYFITTMVGGAESVRMYMNFDSTTFNDSGVDVDFRVESDDNDHMLFVDASADAVGIGTASPSAPLHIQTNTAETNDSVTGLMITTLSTGTTTTNFGGAIQFQAERNNGVNQNTGLISNLADVNSGSDISSGFRFSTSTAGALAEKMRLTYDGKLGIGTDSPTGNLDIKSASSTYLDIDSGTNLNAGLRLYENDTFKWQLYNDGDTGDEYKIDNSSGTSMTFQQDGDVMVGTLADAYPAGKFHTFTTTAETYAATFRHDGAATTSYGIGVLCGTDDASGTNTAFNIQDGNGDGIGNITFTGSTVSYNAFSASHYTKLPDADDAAGYDYGTLVETTEVIYTQKNGADSERGLVYKVQKSSSANSKAVLGAYSGKYNTPEGENYHLVYVLGDGHILCNNSGGNISVGDGICTSSTAGIGAKATVSPSMIIGIAQKDITFSGSETKLVPVQYGLQQFTPWT